MQNISNIIFIILCLIYFLNKYFLLQEAEEVILRVRSEGAGVETLEETTQEDIL